MSGTNEKTRILIVDDNASLCKTMSFVLERKGYATTIAKNGPEAIENVKEQVFEMIFMDIKMPVMDGVETYKKIKKLRPNAAVMMMTAYAVEDLVQEVLKEGAYGIIYKPLDIDKVLVHIESVMETKQGMLVLIVDDDIGTCKSFKNILVKKGYNVGIAHNGEEAIALAQNKKFDLIFIDMKLPTINGLETYLAIKEINPKAVTIMMTGYREEMAELVEKAMKNSAYACMYKPIDMEQLLGLVGEIQERKQEAGRLEK